MTATAAPSLWRLAIARGVSLTSTAAVGSRPQIATGVALAAAYLLALGSGSEQAAMVVVLATAGVSLAWPVAGLAMFVIVMPIREPELLVPVRVNAILAGAIAFGCILRAPIDRLRLRPHPGILLLLGYLAISALSILPVLNGHPPGWLPSALNLLLRLVTGVALFLSAMYLFRLMHAGPILVLGIAGVVLAALLAVGQMANSLPFEAITGGLVTEASGQRASGSFSDPNFLGVYLAVAAMFCLGMLGAVGRPLRVVLFGLVALLVIATGLTYSRTALIGLATGLTVLAGLRHWPAGVVVASALGALALVLYPTFLELRQGGELHPLESLSMESSLASRSNLVAAGIGMFAANPVFGVGFGVFQFVSPEYLGGGLADSTFSHNQYLNVLAEQGLVGGVVAAAAIALLALVLVRSRSPWQAGALAMGVTFLVASIYLHTATVFQTCSFLWLALAATLASRPDRSVPVEDH